MNDLQICSKLFGTDTPDGDDCKWVAWAFNRGLSLTRNEEIIRDLMLAGY